MGMLNYKYRAQINIMHVICILAGGSDESPGSGVHSCAMSLMVLVFTAVPGFGGLGI